MQALIIGAFKKSQWTALVTGRYITIMVLLCYVNLSGGQMCTDTVDIGQNGDRNLARTDGRLAIIPRLNFTCNGRITGISARVSSSERIGDLLFQVWRRASANSTIYNIIGEVPLQSSQVTGRDTYRTANIILNGNDRIEFQSGDVLGYYHASNSRYLLRDIRTDGYVLYRFDGSPVPSSVNLESRDAMINFRQPLIQFTIDVSCDNLSAPTNGGITSCSSGTVGVGYEGDTCSFTCNTGYELTGSDTRTCQREGSWSGRDDVCRRVPCSLLTDPNNGTINCSLGDDGVPSYGDTCSFTCNTGYELIGNDTRTCQSNGNWDSANATCRRVPCSMLISPENGMIRCSIMENNRVPSFEDTCSFTCNTGYELTGSDTRTCQSNGSWSGSDIMCSRVSCPSLTIPDNGMISCSLGYFSYEDTCSFTCNTGYELTGSTERTCQSDGSWSGSPVSCIIMECPSSSLPMNSMLAESCSSTYQSMCELQCQEGFTGTGDPLYMCDVLSNGQSVIWIELTSASWRCERMRCSPLTSPNNGTISCSPGDVGMLTYEDTCSFTCNIGYELTGSDTRTCQSEGSWNGTDAMCSRVQCSSPLNITLHCPAEVITAVFEDTCTFSCNAGYELQGSKNGTCLANQSWSGGDPICVALNCSTSPPLNNSQLQSSCDTQYQSTCTTVCVDGYTGVGGSYTCVVTDEDANSVGWNGSTSCARANCSQLMDPNNGIISCSLGNDGIPSYEDICSFTCNPGFELTGNDTRICQNDGSWSGNDDVCRRVFCPSFNHPNNGTVSCSLGDDKVSSYEDTCSFTCNTGYELTGSDTRICQSDRSWSGNETICERVQCPDLSSPTNGNISCDSADVSHYEDQCSFSCDPGYELTGSSSRQCLSNESWSGSDVTCDILHCDNLTDTINNSVLANDCGSEFGSVCRVECNTGYRAVGNDTFTCASTNDTIEWRNNVSGETFQCDIVTCEDLDTPANGSINCSSDDRPLQYQDSCTIQCNDGYELQGSVIRQCEASGQWSGSRTQCNIRHCPDITGLVPNSRSCDTSYTSICMVECDDGYIISGDSYQYSCGLNGTEVAWMFNGREVTCSPVPCISLSDPKNGNVTCPSNTSVFQDTCSYYCDRGYQLEGNRQTRCDADQTWSSEPVTCTILKCNDPEVEIANSQSVGACDVTYGSNCSLNCSSGFSASGNGEHVCDDVSDEGTSVQWRSEGGVFSCTVAETSSDSTSGSGVPIPVIAGAGGGGGAVLFVIILLCVVFLCCKHRSQKKKAYSISTMYSSIDAHSDNNNYGKAEANPAIVSNALYSSVESNSQPSKPKKGHKQLHKQSSLIVQNAMFCFEDENAASKCDDPSYYNFQNHNTVDKAADSTEEIYSYAAMQHSEAAQIEEEQIYETPCEDDDDYGPIYTEPPMEVEKIYEKFEDKRFCKLYHQNIRIFEELGSGEFGIVNRGQLTTPTGDVEVAVKTLNTKASDKDKLRFLQEAAIMCQFDHQNVIKLHGVVTEAPTMIVLEYVARGDLKEFLMKAQPLNQENVHPKLPLLLLKFCLEISAGMTYLSSKQFVHRDLAARNVLVSEKCVCKIADFGMSRDLIDENYYITSGGLIPVKWTAPEVLHYRKYSVQSDVWSYGCVLYEIWSLGYKPFEESTNPEAIEKIDSGYRLPPPSGCPRAIYRMMIKCWHPDPRSRPQFGQITKLLSGNSGYLLKWSDKDDQAGSKHAKMLGAPLDCAYNLYLDLQQKYWHKN